MTKLHSFYDEKYEFERKEKKPIPSVSIDGLIESRFQAAAKYLSLELSSSPPPRPFQYP